MAPKTAESRVKDGAPVDRDEPRRDGLPIGLRVH